MGLIISKYIYNSEINNRTLEGLSALVKQSRVHRQECRLERMTEVPHFLMLHVHIGGSVTYI